MDMTKFGHDNLENEAAVDVLVLNRHGVFGLIILFLVCGFSSLAAVRQGARVPLTHIFA